MEYKVLESGGEIKNSPEVVYLIEDQWDDWFTYHTMYDLYFINKFKERKYIGKIKIGEKGMKGEGNKRPNLPLKFNKLGDNFFSLGQSDYYYDNIKSLGDELREEILTELNDIAMNSEIYNKFINEGVMQSSLLRDISRKTVTTQFRRIARGGARLTKYNFNYEAPIIEGSDIDPMKLSFKVIPESKPPTNIHVIIGRNGVGKTHLIISMIKAISNEKDIKKNGNFIFEENVEDIFSKVIFVSFSAFDQLNDVDNINNINVPFIKIGLNKGNNDNKDNMEKSFSDSLYSCLSGIKRNLLIKSVEILSSDPIFNQTNIVDLCNSIKSGEKKIREEFLSKSADIFKKLSSGHKIIILTIVKLIENVEEKTLVLLDEPEGHLHPPLLASFVRALSELLTNRNGVAIIATHSPVILQEVPKSCVWKLRRNGKNSIAERLKIESFGENIALLTEEVFGLEVTNSGYHNMLVKAVEKYKDYYNIIEEFGGQLGSEARAILKTLINIDKEGE